MKMRSTLPTLLVLFLATTIATTQSSSATAPGHGPSAFGQGAFTFFNGFRNEAWSFSFEAMANKNGHARGRAIFGISDNFTETQVVVKIDCLNVQSSSSGISDAVITGTVLHSDDPDFPKRANVVFGAEDSSGFPTTRADVITPLFVIPFEGDCHDIGQPLTMFQLSPDAITIEP